MNRIELGRHGERLAVATLEADGLTVIDRNWYCADGEIDLVALGEHDNESTLVFCEVKTRAGLGFGTPLESITERKLQRMRLLAHRWLHQHQRPASRIRLDAVGVLLLPGREPVIDHVRDIGR